MDRSTTRQDEFSQVATKIKMPRNRSMSEHITKDRILRNDMIDAGCEEIVNDMEEERRVQ